MSHIGSNLLLCCYLSVELFFVVEHVSVLSVVVLLLIDSFSSI